MSFSKLISDLHEAQSIAFSEVAADESVATQRNKIGQVLVDIGKCADTLVHRYEADLYELAIKEIQLALLAALGASYRQAFMGLRLALEHWFSGIHYSTNELHFRKWQLAKRDTSWSELNDTDHGILSDEFASIFWSSSEHRISHYRKLASQLYRECSEYVHGNPKTHLYLPQQIQYDPKSFLAWQKSLEVVKLLIIYTFVTRFGSSMAVGERELISQLVLETIGHLNEARELFTGA